MKLQLSEKYITKFKIHRSVLPWKANSYRVKMCAPPNSNSLQISTAKNERTALCILRGSITVEAALCIPFVLMMFLAFYSFFSKHASAAEVKILAAAEAKTMGVTAGVILQSENPEVTIYKGKSLEGMWSGPFYTERYVVQSAVCRAWVGFTELEIKETYVYITPNGSVYHLYSDCTHLNLSIRQVTLASALLLKNEYGEKYHKCELCKVDFGTMVYITSEGNRYHAERICGGLKRTVQQVPISLVSGRGSCLRCMKREGL